MTFTVEISCYPLSADYIRIIDAFIKKMNTYSGIKCITSPSNTLIVGDSIEVFTALQTEIQRTFTDNGKATFVMKVFQGDLTESVDLTPYAS